MIIQQTILSHQSHVLKCLSIICQNTVFQHGYFSLEALIEIDLINGAPVLNVYEIVMGCLFMGGGGEGEEFEV